MGIVLWVIATLTLLAFLYWLIVVGEGTYLGRYVVRFIYQRGATIYDSTRHAITAHDETLLVPLLRSTLATVDFAQVLDVGTGTGRVPLLVAHQPWFQGHVTGLDFSSAMLGQARAKILAAGLSERISLRQGNAGTLPWPDASFDLITSLEALEYFPQPRAALIEMVRTLRPGGRLIVSKFTDGWARLLPLKGLTQQQMIGLLERAGMDEIEVRTWQPGNYDLVIARKRF